MIYKIRQKTIRSFSGLIALRDNMNRAIVTWNSHFARDSDITHGVRMSLLPGVISISEKFLGLEKNEINFDNLKVNTCPVNLFQVFFIGFCHLAIQRDQYRKLSIILPRAKSQIHLSFFLKLILSPSDLPVPTMKNFESLYTKIQWPQWPKSLCPKQRDMFCLTNAMDSLTYREDGKTEA